MAATGGTPPPQSPAGGGGSDNPDYLGKLMSGLPSLTEKVRQRHEHLLEERKKKEIEIGLVGRLIGDVEPIVRVVFVLLCIYGVFLLIVLGCVVWVYLATGKEPSFLDKFVTGVLALLSGGFGFLIGRQRANSSRPREKPAQERSPR